jgi:F0F1-type ATP synthase assembly protein I
LPEPKKDRKIWIDDWRQDSLRWMGVGIEFCMVAGGAAWIGNWLDKLTDTSPGFMIMGFFAGFGYMLYTMIKRSGGIKFK